MRVLIVGAGPTGLTAAVELARLGVRAEVIERRADPSGLSRAVGIFSAAMRILTPSGVASAIDAEAVQVTGLALYDGTRRIALLPVNFDATARLWALAQDRTETHLAAALQLLGGTIRFGTPFEALQQDGDAVEVTAGGETRSYDWVIGADGAHSAVRAALGVEFVGHDLPERWGVADVEAPAWGDPGLFHAFLRPAGEIVIVVPLAEGRFRVIASDPDALAALPVPMPVERVRDSGSFLIPVRLASSYRVGRVLLAGDAAHCHSPVGGRGMNTGIADAADLAQRLMEGTVDGYHTARHAEGARIVALTERARRVVQTPDGWRKGLLKATVRSLAAMPPLARIAVRRLVNL